jgi:hypothetical protein
MTESLVIICIDLKPEVIHFARIAQELLVTQNILLISMNVRYIKKTGKDLLKLQGIIE